MHRDQHNAANLQRAPRDWTHLRGAYVNKKMLVAISFVLLLGIAVVAAQSTSSSSSAPLVWNAKIDVLGNYIMGKYLPLESKVVSTFTPSSDITVTRMQLQAASGATLGGIPPASCTVVPTVHLYDSRDRLGIDIPNGPVGTGKYGSYVGSVSSDSGPVSVHFSAGTPISVVAIPGDEVNGSFCSAYEINIVVQYQAP